MSYQMKSAPGTPRRRLVRPLIIILVILLLAGGGYAVWKMRHKDAAPVANGPNSIKYAPATPEEKQQAEDSKDRIVEQRDQTTPPPSTPSGKKAVQPVISLAAFQSGTVTIQGFTPGIFEDGGSCTATLTKDGQTVTKQASAFANATTTDCQHIDIPRSEFPSAGTWNVKLSYSSSTAEGSSTSTTTVGVQ